MEGQFTYTYSQPEGYRFCQDSVLFPKFVAGQIGDRISSRSRILDVCAGCGVIGFELRYHLPQITQLDFLEVQDEFQEHFFSNRNMAVSTDPERARFRFIHANYARLSSPEFTGQYDFIAGNPPYFVESEGKLSHKPLNDRCRFFLDDSFESLIQGVVNALKPGGEAYLLCKSGKAHGRNSLREIRRYCALNASADFVKSIRTTQVLRLIKNFGS